MSAFDTAFAYVVGEEGALSLDPRDPGNWTGGAQGVGQLKGTKFGISAAAYPTRDIADITLAEAKLLYQTDFWIPARCPLYPDGIALMVFDAAVNQGVSRAIKMLQEALGVRTDGAVGPGTLGALHLSSLPVLVQEYAQIRIEHYQKDEGWNIYGKGWTARANTTASTAAALV